MSSVSSAGHFKMTVINSLDPDQSDLNSLDTDQCLHCMRKSS